MISSMILGGIVWEDTKHGFAGKNLWEISSIILEGIIWEDIKHGFRGNLLEVPSMNLGDEL